MKFALECNPHSNVIRNFWEKKKEIRGLFSSKYGIYILWTVFIFYSVHMSGFIIHALALKLPPRANGIAPLVKEILLGEKAVNKMMIDCNH